jgi:hypothetical protein
MFRRDIMKRVSDDAIIYTDLGDCDTDDDIEDWDIQFEGKCRR